MNILHTLFAVRPRREMRELYIFSILFSFASSLILIFEPVFLYQQGLSLSKIALFYALHYTLYVFTLPLGGKFASRFGTERSIALSMPLFVIYFLVLATVPRIPQLVWVSWIFLTAFKTLYWPSYHTEVAKFGDGKNRGTELSWMYAATRGVGVIGPIVGGVVAAKLGFPALFVVASVMALVSTVPLLKTKERYRIVEFPYSLPWRMVMSRQQRSLRKTMGGWGENLVDLVFWPIFIFTIVGGVEQLGFLSAAGVLVMALLGFFIGEISDRVPRRFVLRLHLPFLTMSYLLRPIASSTMGVLLTDLIGKASFIGVRIPMWYKLFVQAKRVGVLRYIVTLEMLLAISKAVTAWILVIIFAVTLPYTGFVVAFVLAAVLSLLFIAL